MNVLLVDDDTRLTALLTEYLGKNDVSVRVAADGERGLDAVKQGGVDVVVLDLMLPGIDGLEVCRRIRAAPDLAHLPVLMLTARGDDVDKVVGLELGADHYVAQPFNPRELLARLRALARRAAGPGSEGERFAAGGLVIDFAAREVIIEGRREVLTHFEFELLALLARARGRVLSREHIMDALKGEDLDSFDRSIDVHVSRLRAKIERDPKKPRFIKTVRGVGYVLARPE
jgi:two-component system phosphate regulon response regulator OmpR